MVRAGETSSWRWVIGASVSAMVLGAFTLWSARAGTVACGGDLVTVLEPSGWTALPPHSDISPFVFRAKSMMPKYGLGSLDAALVDPSSCPRERISVAGWFEHGPEPAYMRHPGELTLRETPNGVFVVTARVVESGRPPGPESFLVAFQRVRSSRRGFATDRWMWLSVALGAGCVAASVLSVRSWLLLRHHTEEGIATSRRWARRAVIVAALTLAAIVAGIAALNAFASLQNFY